MTIISAHKLHIETRRYTVPRKTPLDKRTCTICKENVIEDEFHFIMECNQYSNERQDFSDNLSSFTTFNQLSTADQFIFIMSYNKGATEILNHVLEYICILTEKRVSLLQ